MSTAGGWPAGVPGRQTRPQYRDVVIKIHLGCNFLVMNSSLVLEVVFSVYILFSFLHLGFSFFLVITLCFYIFLVSVKMPAKSVWWAVWLGPRWGLWRQQIGELHCHHHRVQTNSHGNPGCGTPFSVSPRGPSLPPGSRPALTWHRSGSYPSNWQEKTQ